MPHVLSSPKPVALLLVVLGCGRPGPAPTEVASDASRNRWDAGQPVTSELGRRAEAAVAGGAGAVDELVASRLRDDPEALRSFIHDEAALHVVLALGYSLRGQGKLALLDAPHQLLVEQYATILEWHPTPPDGGSADTDASAPSSPQDFYVDNNVSVDVSTAATRIVLAKVRPGGQHGAPYSWVLHYHITQAQKSPELDPEVVRLIAGGLLSEYEEDEFPRLYDERAVPMVATALRIPGCDPAVRDLAARLWDAREQPPANSTNEALAAFLDDWWRNDGPYMYFNSRWDEGSFLPRPPGWIAVDEWAMFTGETWGIRWFKQPRAWTNIPEEKRSPLARESLRRRKESFGEWSKWVEERKKEFGLP